MYWRGWIEWYLTASTKFDFPDVSLVSSPATSTSRLLETQLPEQLCEVLVYAVNNTVESFFELLLQLVEALLLRAESNMKEKGEIHPIITRLWTLFERSDVFTTLVQHQDDTVSEKAAEVVALVAHLQRMVSVVAKK